MPVQDCNDAFEEILQALVTSMESADEKIKAKDTSASQKAEDINSIN